MIGAAMTMLVLSSDITNVSGNRMNAMIAHRTCPTGTPDLGTGGDIWVTESFICLTRLTHGQTTLEVLACSAERREGFPRIETLPERHFISLLLGQNRRKIRGPLGRQDRDPVLIAEDDIARANHDAPNGDGNIDRALETENARRESRDCSVVYGKCERYDLRHIGHRPRDHSPGDPRFIAA